MDGISRYSHQQLIEQATLSKEDMHEISQCRGSHSRLGFAYQIGFVRLRNRFPVQSPFEVLDDLLQYTSVQTGSESSEINQYASRQATISEHQNAIRRYLNLKELVDANMESVKQYIFEQSCRLEQTSALYSLAGQYLREQNILQPAGSTMQRIIGEQRRLAQQHIYEKITKSLPKETMQKLDMLLEVEEGTVSPLQQLKAAPRNPSPSALLELTYKLAQIASIGILNVDLSWLNNNYQRVLTSYVQRRSAYKLREAMPSHRYAAVTCFLYQTYQDTTDQIVDMYDKLINKVYNWAQGDLDEAIKRKRKSVQKVLAMFTSMGEILLDEANISDDCVRKILFSRFSQEELTERLEQSKEWTTGRNSHIFHGVMGRFTYLRQFSKSLLEHLEFESSQGESSQVKLTSLLDAIETLKEMNRMGKRKLPPEASITFVPDKLRPFIGNNGELNKAAWECALMTALRDEVKSGNLSVAYSKRFRNFDDFFISTTQWQKMRKSFFDAAGLPSDPQEVRTYLTQRLNRAYDSFLESQPSNTYAKVETGGWRLSTDPTEKLEPQEEDKLDQLKSWLKKQMRCIKLPELLIEVDNELHFTQDFMPFASRATRPASDICSVLIAIIANGCNVGPHNMSRMVQGVSYSQIQRITDWQLTEENQRSALASVVNAIANLDISQIWGQGKTSASDGQRFAFRPQVLQQTYTPKFSDFALEFYSFVADNYAPFYSMPIECTDRDAPFVLDGVLYNESDLELEEHYTDTHGYTEINFAAFAMLGRRFCPRIRSVQRQRIYRIDMAKDYGILGPFINRQDRTIKMDWIADQLDRMGQFYATIQSGHTTANIALKRLNSMSPKNEFHRANRELGRIFKTEFILQYMSQPPLRRRVRRGLLKVDELHALSRDIVYGKRGHMTERDFHEMMKTCSCLTLILACIIYWQAKEIGRVVSKCSPEKEGIDISFLEHVSPIEWSNVLLYGEYVIDPNLIR
ncbi:Tn3 family transposase [Candidatus Poribacteria bacterium]